MEFETDSGYNIHTKITETSHLKRLEDLLFY